MAQYIRCEPLKTVFRIEKLDSIKRVCGYEINSLSSEFEFFNITLEKINNGFPTSAQKKDMLKDILPILIEQMKDQNVCVIQLSGDLIEGGLTEYYPFILTTGNRRYYCPEVIYNTCEEGFIHSWISFDFNKDVLKEMPFNEANVQADGLIISPDLPDVYNTFFMQEWSHKNLESLLKASSIYFSTDDDFEYFGVASKIPMETIVKKWQEGLDLYDQEQQENK